MRLLNVSSLRLEEFVADHPPYAILSHTWGDGEVLFDDRHNLSSAFERILPWHERSRPQTHDSLVTERIRPEFPNGTRIDPFVLKKGYWKVKRCCELAQIQGYNFIWVDTFCIDKSSSAELSGAINSMFGYYRRSSVCYVLLEDFDPDEADEFEQLQKARWTIRGWTLQELIAPDEVQFYDSSWNFYGTRRSLALPLQRSTLVDLKVLQRERGEPLDLSLLSVAQRLSWAAGRITKRPEDIAYCLLGLFDVNMPLLYGEGSEKAFYRLQEEIMKYSMDQSILAWQDQASPRLPMGILAKSPDAFARSADIICFWADSEPFQMTNKGLRATLPTLVDQQSGSRRIMLNCRYQDDFDAPLCLTITEATDGGTSGHKLYHRLNSLYRGDWEDVHKSVPETLYLARTMPSPSRTSFGGFCFWFRFKNSAAAHGSQLRYWRLAQPSAGTWVETTRKPRLDVNGVHAATTSKISTYLVEYSELAAPTEHPRIRFAIKRGESFHCSRTTVFPSYVCGFEDVTCEDLLPSYQCVRGNFKHRIRASMTGIPKRVMDEIIYEVNLDFDVEIQTVRAKTLETTSSGEPANVK